MQEQQPVNDLMRYPEAAEFLRMKMSSLYSAVSRKRIPHYRLSGRDVRFSRKTLTAWLLRREVCPADDADHADAE
jgi:excisionase family DNA binding protein